MSCLSDKEPQNYKPSSFIERVLLQSLRCNSLFGIFPIEIINKIANEAMVSILIRKWGKMAPYYTVNRGKEDWLRLLKDAGCNLEQADVFDRTPAYIAALKGYEGCLRLLNKTGYNLTDKRGRTPAQMAAEKGHEGCLRILKEAGCDLGKADKDGDNPVTEAIANGQESCLRLLVEAGCDVCKTYENWSTATIAIENGREGCLRILVEAGCDLEQRIGEDGDTLACIAAQNGQEGCMRVLNEFGCDLNKVNNWGENPVHWAAQFGEIEVLCMLIEIGCNLNKVSTDTHETPAQMADNHDHVSCLRLLQEAGCDGNYLH